MIDSENYMNKILSDGGLGGDIYQNHDYRVTEEQKSMILELAKDAYKEIHENGNLSSETYELMVNTINVLTLPFSYLLRDLKMDNEDINSIEYLLANFLYYLRYKN